MQCIVAWVLSPLFSCRFFDEISQDTGKFVFGVADTLQCLDMGAVETLIVWENLEVCLWSLQIWIVLNCPLVYALRAPCYKFPIVAQRSF